MEYPPTAHNRSVYAAPLKRLGLPFARSFRYASFPRSLQTHLGGTKPYGFLYSAAQTSHTAGTLYAIGLKLFKMGKNDTLDRKIINQL